MTSRTDDPDPAPSPGAELVRELARLVRPRPEPSEPRQLGVHEHEYHEYDD
jgi:hypothetical protein